MSRKKSAFVDYGEYTLGFSVIDGRDTGYENRLTPGGFFDRIDIAPVDPVTGKPTINMLTPEQKAVLDEAWSDDSTTDPTGQTLQVPFERKRDEALTFNKNVIDVYLSVNDTPAGDLVLAFIETIVNRLNICWYNKSEMTAGDENYQQALELKDELVQDILFPTIMGQLNGVKYRDFLIEAWGDAGEGRIQFMMDNYIPYIRKNKCKNEAINYATNDMAKKLKAVGYKVEKEERRNMWIYLAIVSKMHPKFSKFVETLTWTDPSCDEVSQKFHLKTVLRSVATIAYWTMLSKMIDENQDPGGEPGWEQLESKTELYERDFADLERMARDGSGEIWFNQCFSAFQWTQTTSEDGNTEKTLERTNYYRKAVDSRESKNSLDLGVQLLTMIRDLFLKGVDINKYKISKKGSRIHNMRIIDLIKYYNGRAYLSIKKVEVEGQEPVNCKKFSYQRLMDYHAKLVTKVYWDIWRLQNEEITTQSLRA